jgi:hypothetical protein
MQQTNFAPGTRRFPVEPSSNPFDNRNEVDTSSADRAPDVGSKTCSNEAEDDASSLRSTTSTVQYSQELYSSFQLNTTQLSVELFPGCSTKDITIQRIKGGSFNRIIGITLYKPEQDFPWYDMAKLRPMISACVRGKKTPCTHSKAVYPTYPLG